MPWSVVTMRMHTPDCPSNFGEPCGCDFEEAACDGCSTVGPLTVEDSDGVKLCEWCYWEGLTHKEAKQKMSRTRGEWKTHGTMVYAPGGFGANICEVSEPHGSGYVEHHRVEIGSPDIDEAYANAKFIAMAPSMFDAGNTLASYVYSIMNPGAIPQTIKNAMRVFEEAGKL